MSNKQHNAKKILKPQSRCCQRSGAPNNNRLCVWASKNIYQATLSNAVIPHLIYPRCIHGIWLKTIKNFKRWSYSCKKRNSEIDNWSANRSNCGNNGLFLVGFLGAEFKHFYFGVWLGYGKKRKDVDDSKIM